MLNNVTCKQDGEDGEGAMNLIKNKICNRF